MIFEWFEISRAGAKRKLLPRLKNRVFHITTIDNFTLIIKSGAIMNNQDGLLQTNWTNNSYFLNKGCVSVCDFFNNNANRNKQREAALSKYDIFGQTSKMGQTVYLFLNPKCFSRLITWETWKNEEKWTESVVPYLESGYPGSIDLNNIDEVWLIKIKDAINY